MICLPGKSQARSLVPAELLLEGVGYTCGVHHTASHSLQLQVSGECFSDLYQLKLRTLTDACQYMGAALPLDIYSRSMEAICGTPMCRQTRNPGAHHF